MGEKLQRFYLVNIFCMFKEYDRCRNWCKDDYKGLNTYKSFERFNKSKPRVVKPEPEPEPESHEDDVKL